MTELASASTYPGTGALERVIRRAATRQQESEERCELCSVPVPPGHRHLLDTERGEVLCCCQACSLLFDKEAASKGHYRLVPRQRVRLPAVPTKDLGVPVGLAFFVPHADGRVIAHYPSPAWATQWEVDPQAWAEVVDGCPALRTLAADVQALLVNTARGEQHHWLVPIDDCFRLVAVVRGEWKGLSGGSRVWPEIERFFAELTEQR
ncbi:MAG: hypothetical protein JO287_19385 [Pseudonocardiales bacterium]|nr:hypothetical protein [Pseudonocardiales bacterium]